MKISLKVITVVLAAIISQVVTPDSAHACVWSATHAFSPLPPCDVRDTELVKETKKMNAAIMSKIALTSSKLAIIQQEISAWHSVLDGTNDYLKLIENVHIDGIPSPLPALVAEFNRQAPTSRYVQLEQDGGFRLVHEEQEIFRVASGILESLSNPEEVAELYGYKLSSSITNNWEATKNTVARQVAATFDHRQYSQTIADHLYPLGERTASRYIDVSDDGGLAEAAISNMSATLSGLIGTSAEIEALAHEMRMNATRNALRRRWERVDEAVLLEPISF